MSNYSRLRRNGQFDADRFHGIRILERYIFHYFTRDVPKLVIDLRFTANSFNFCDASDTSDAVSFTDLVDPSDLDDSPLSAFFSSIPEGEKSDNSLVFGILKETFPILVNGADPDGLVVLFLEGSVLFPAFISSCPEREKELFFVFGILKEIFAILFNDVDRDGPGVLFLEESVWFAVFISSFPEREKELFFVFMKF